MHLPLCRPLCKLKPVRSIHQHFDCRKSFTEIDRDRLERTFNVNIVAYMSVAAKAVKHMSKGSAIINVCSIQAFQPMSGILDYASTKGAITTFTKVFDYSSTLYSSRHSACAQQYQEALDSGMFQ